MIPCKTSEKLFKPMLKQSKLKPIENTEKYKPWTGHIPKFCTLIYGVGQCVTSGTQLKRGILGILDPDVADSFLF